MLTSKSGPLAASLFVGLLISSTPAFASDADGAGQSFGPVDDRASAPIDADSSNGVGAIAGFSLSANAALVSQYRFRGVDLSGGDIAIQGGVDLAHDSGFYLGTWGSSLDEDTVGYGHTELDVYGGFSTDVAEGITLDLGAIGYLYPNAGPGKFDYFEAYGSAAFSLGPANAKLGVAYAPKQDSLGGTDNLYIYSDLGASLPGTPISLTGHLGYTDGFLTFTNDSTAIDWSIGAEAAIAGPVTLGVSYVGAQGDFAPGAYNFTRDAVVVSLSASI